MALNPAHLLKLFEGNLLRNMQISSEKVIEDGDGSVAEFLPESDSGLGLPDHGGGHEHRHVLVVKVVVADFVVLNPQQLAVGEKTIALVMRTVNAVDPVVHRVILVC